MVVAPPNELPIIPAMLKWKITFELTKDEVKSRWLLNWPKTRIQLPPTPHYHTSTSINLQILPSKLKLEETGD